MNRRLTALLRALLVFALLTQLLPPPRLSAAERLEENVTPQPRTWQNSRAAPTRSALSSFFADRNGDQRVDQADLALAALSWNCATGDACYAAELDRDSNGRIDASDLAAFGNEYDIDPPVIAITAPADNGVVRGASLRVEGSVTDRHAVSQVLVNGVAAAVNGNSFSADIPAADGPLAVNVAALDALGQSSSAGVLVTVDNEGPFIQVNEPANRRAVYTHRPQISLSFFDLASPVQPGSLSATLTDENGGVTDISGQLVVSGATASGAPGADLQENMAYTLTATMRDAAGNTGQVSSSFYVPPSPTSLTPPQWTETSGWVSGIVYDAATCGGDIEFEPEGCAGLAGAKVTLEKVDTALLQEARALRRQDLAASRSPYGLPDFVDPRAKSAFTAVPGTAVTGPGGFFAFPVESTGSYALRVEKEGYTYGQRMAQIVLERSTPTNDIFISPLDASSTQCTAAGCLHTSADGQMELIVPAGAIPSGQTLDIRATEFDQVNFLPSGELPQGTAETYAFNLSGASEFVFAQPVTVRLKNSRGFAPGDVIPLGYWNQSLLQWEDAGIATVSGDGVWLEMQVTHFSNFDPNQPGALSQSVPSVQESTQTDSEKCANSDCTSNIGVQGGVLGQTVDLPTVDVLDDPFGLTFSYDSGRANPSEVIDIEIGMERLDPGTELKNFVQAELFIEGEKTAQFTFPLDSAVQAGDEVGRFRILWDGRDSQGRKLPPGVYRYAVKVRLNFRAQFFRAPFFGAPPDFTKPTGVFRNGSTDTFLFGSVLLKGDADNFFGAGWYLEGQQRLYDAQNGDILVIDGQNIATQYLFAGGNLLDNPATARAVNPLGGIHARPGVRSLQHNLPVGGEWEVAGGGLQVAGGESQVAGGGLQVAGGGLQVAGGESQVADASEAVSTLHLPVINAPQSSLPNTQSPIPNTQSPIPNPQSPRAAATNISADITTDTTFTAAGSPYRLLKDVTIAAGATLTVETGVVVKGVVAGQTVPTLFVEGQLRADGAIFSSDTEPNVGSAWGGIVIRKGGRADLQNTQVKFGGRATVAADREAAIGVIDATLVMTDSTIFDSINFNSVMEGCLYVENSSVRLTNVLLDLCGSGISGANSQAALVLKGATTDFRAANVTVQNTTGYVAALEHHLFGQLVGVTFQNNNKSRFFLLGSSLTGSHTISPVGGVGVIDYRGDRTIAAGATITLTAGVQMQGEADSDEWIVLGRLVTRGNPASPVVFTSQADGGTLNSGSEWGGVRVNGGAADLEHTVIRFAGNVTAGSEKAALAVIDGDLRLINSTLFRNGDRSGVNDSFVYIQDSVALIDGSLLTDDGLNGANPSFGISVIETSARAGAATSFTLRNSEIVHPRRPLRLAHKHLAGVGQGVRLDARFDQRIFLTDRAFDTPTTLAPVGNLGNYEFDLDLTVRGDLTIEPGVALFNNGDGLIIDGGSLRAIGTEDAPIRFVGLQQGGVRTWDGIFLRNGGSAELDRVEIRDAVRGVRSNGGSLSVRNSKFSANTVGVRVEGAVPGFFARFNEFSGNTTAGLENGSSTTIDARLNFWGAANGPVHPNNAGGTGDKINGGVKVIFQPFLSTPVTSDGGNAGAENRTAHDNSFLTFDEADSTFTRHYPDGRTVHFNADGSHDFTQDPTGNRLRYVYNPDGSTARVEFVAAGRGTADWVWDIGYQVLGIRDAARQADAPISNIQYLLTRNPAAAVNVVTVTDPAGRVTTLTVDDLGRLAALQEPGLDAAMQFSYDGQGNMTHKRDARGFVTRYEYDEFGRVERALLPPREVFDPETGQFRQEQEIHTLTSADSGGLLNGIDPGNPTAPGAPLVSSAQIVAQYAFGTESFSVRTNSFGALTGMTDALGRTTGFDRDGRDRLTRQTTPEGNCVEFTYDENDNVLSETRMDRTACEGNLAAGLVQTTTFTYEARFNRLKTVTDPLGNTTTYVYDYEEGSGEAGLKVRHIFPAVQDENGQTVTPEERYLYNGQGQMTELIDRRGNKTCFVYTSGAPGEAGTIFAPGVTPVPGLLTRLVEDCGGALERATAFRQFDATGNAQVIEEPFGAAEGRSQLATRNTQFSFDVRGRLIETTDPLGRVTRIRYDNEDNRVEVVADVAGRPLTTTTTFNPINQPLTQVLASAGERIESRYGYNINRQMTLSQDGRGNSTRFHYDPVGQMVKITDALGNTTGFAYDGDGRLTRMINAKGVVTTYRYDGLDRLLEEVQDPAGLGLTNQFAYDPNNNPVRVTDANGVVTCLEYDAWDRPVKTIHDCGGLDATTTTRYSLNSFIAAVIDPLGRTTRFAFDSLNRNNSIIDGLGQTYTYTYDLANLVTEEGDPLGRTTRYSYDQRYRQTAITDALGQTTQYRYDSRDNLVEVTDKLGRVSRMEYDGLDRLIASTDPTGAVTRFVYDATGNVIQQTDGLGRTRHTEYDPLGRPARLIDALGQVTTLAYDANSNLTRTTDALGNSVQTAYDALDRLIRLTDQKRNVAQFTFDGAGNQTALIDPLGRTTQLAYDNLYRRVQVTDALGGVTQFAHDLTGKVTSLTDPAGNRSTFAYDGLDRLLSETNALGAARTYTYDALGNQTSVTDRNGRVRRFTFDALNRPTGETWENGNYSAGYAYDAVGQLISAGDPAADYTFAYDGAGRVTEQNESLNSAARAAANADVDFTFQYDAVGNLSQMVEKLNGQNRAVTDYRRDLLDRITRITQRGAGVAEKRADISYDALSRLTAITRFGDAAGSQTAVATQYSYDAKNLLTRLRHVAGANTRTYDYTYDAASRLTRLVSPDGTSNYSYDDFDQLTAAVHNFQANESYNYDANGNRTGGGHQTGAGNRLLDDGTFRYEYDAEGNRTKRIHNSTGAVTEYTWDFRNRLTRIVAKDGGGAVLSTVEQTYNVFDERIVRTENGSSRQYALARGLVQTVVNAGGQVSNRYLHGPLLDQVLADEQAGGVLYPLADHQMTARDLVNAGGQIVNHRVYDSFGKLVSESNPAVDYLFGYTGREMDETTGLHYYRARHYDGATGRFLSEDPLDYLAGDTNLSRYVGNAPTTRVDPLGLFDNEADLMRALGMLPDAAALESEAAAIAAENAAIKKQMQELVAKRLGLSADDVAKQGDVLKNALLREDAIKAAKNAAKDKAIQQMRAIAALKGLGNKALSLLGGALKLAGIFGMTKSLTEIIGEGAAGIFLWQQDIHNNLMVQAVREEHQRRMNEIHNERVRKQNAEIRKQRERERQEADARRAQEKLQDDIIRNQALAEQRFLEEQRNKRRKGGSTQPGGFDAAQFAQMLAQDEASKEPAVTKRASGDIPPSNPNGLVGFLDYLAEKHGVTTPGGSSSSPSGPGNPAGNTSGSGSPAPAAPGSGQPADPCFPNEGK